ncbi:TetR/AcrR family transcriptional regulator [Speluncibacter jeojiensis]|uniref:TetR/AcrR family transcriptional regulator n=1 Tax=Speluncibacter jeojiensis TaxID=2710754 RepID=A0A9X4RFG6_9ACTN|nr:TetR/AcrR family transcriptional regulator [Corynebacteriales bacterium D3-21]
MPKIIDHDERRREIIDVTWQLIVDGGIESVTMREIANAAGFANGALKHYFPSKDDIVEATYERALEMMTERVVAAVNESRGLAALRELSWAAMPLDKAGITAGRVLLPFWELSLSNQRLYDHYLEHLENWRGQLFRLLAEAREDGDVVTETPDEQLVDELIVMNVGANIMSLIGPRLSTPALHEAHLTAFFDRITAK